MSQNWKSILRSNIRKWDELADLLNLSEAQRDRISTSPDFPLNLPRRLAEKIEPGRLDDPILTQFLPLGDEEQQVAGFTADPVGEKAVRSEERLLHKYAGRLLLTASSACAMHCRYCFRRHFDYAQGSSDFLPELDHIRNNSSLSEVILSGGDPLSLSNVAIERLLRELETIPHLRRIRFHTRFPIGIPERIDSDLLSILEKSKLQIWFVIHCNHPRELDQDVLQALRSVLKIGIPVLNQSVLLRGVNDKETTLLELCEILIDSGLTPYYLHQLDRVAGSAHFEVPESRGLELIRYLEDHLPGYGVPRYVREVAGAPSKLAVTSAQPS